MVYKTQKRGNKMCILFTTGCPKCKVLKEKLTQANIPFTEISNTDEILAKGITVVPVLEVDGTRMEFLEANNWIKNRGK